MLTDSYRALRTTAFLICLTTAASAFLTLVLTGSWWAHDLLSWISLGITLIQLLVLWRIARAFDERSERRDNWRTFR